MPQLRPDMPIHARVALIAAVLIVAPIVTIASLLTVAAFGWWAGLRLHCGLIMLLMCWIVIRSAR